MEGVDFQCLYRPAVSEIRILLGGDGCQSFNQIVCHRLDVLGVRARVHCWYLSDDEGCFLVCDEDDGCGACTIICGLLCCRRSCCFCCQSRCFCCCCGLLLGSLLLLCGGLLCRSFSCQIRGRFLCAADWICFRHVLICHDRIPAAVVGCGIVLLRCCYGWRRWRLLVLLRTAEQHKIVDAITIVLSN